MIHLDHPRPSSPYLDSASIYPPSDARDDARAAQWPADDIALPTDSPSATLFGHDGLQGLPQSGAPRYPQDEDMTGQGQGVARSIQKNGESTDHPGSPSPPLDARDPQPSWSAASPRSQPASPSRHAAGSRPPSGSSSPAPPGRSSPSGTKADLSNRFAEDDADPPDITPEPSMDNTAQYPSRPASPHLPNGSAQDRGFSTPASSSHSREEGDLSPKAESVTRDFGADGKAEETSSKRDARAADGVFLGEEKTGISAENPGNSLGDPTFTRNLANGPFSGASPSAPASNSGLDDAAKDAIIGSHAPRQLQPSSAPVHSPPSRQPSTLSTIVNGAASITSQSTYPFSSHGNVQSLGSALSPPESAKSSSNPKVAAILELNSELFKVCLEFDPKNVASQQERQECVSLLYIALTTGIGMPIKSTPFSVFAGLPLASSRTWRGSLRWQNRTKT
ncbi:hypothetical protein BOTBODRAFT_407990 [Botryobasidium botryosum FD-172 SS1]|uniref:Uncharacterized protein n=1 Tax=Botryobasidium botryosum (strain FD-172 SS1) TaxID=930990 RepID=A0A067MDB9_BOTB1|nr:hypothetical protein BOTBODRAFT_407990 [Botryobasidium botryosum FD-172 SS1]